MKIRTRHFKEIEVANDALLTFPEGIVGFEAQHAYATLKREEEQPFEWLQSVEDEGVAFVVVDPLLFLATYDFEVDDETIALLKISDPAQIRLLTIVTLHSDFKKMTANLLAPIIINTESRLARQIILNNTGYTTAHPVFPG